MHARTHARTHARASKHRTARARACERAHPNSLAPSRARTSPLPHTHTHTHIHTPPHCAATAAPARGVATRAPALSANQQARRLRCAQTNRRDVCRRRPARLSVCARRARASLWCHGRKSHSCGVHLGVRGPTAAVDTQLPSVWIQEARVRGWTGRGTRTFLWLRRRLLIHSCRVFEFERRASGVHGQGYVDLVVATAAVDTPPPFYTHRGTWTWWWRRRSATPTRPRPTRPRPP